MKVETHKLTGAALDWAVAKIEGKPIVHDPMGFKSGSEAGYWIWDKTPQGQMTKIGRGYAPSAVWEQGGPIIVREKVETYWHKPLEMWAARHDENLRYGETLLVAAMRCYVTSKLGNELDIPDGLMT